MCNEKFQINVRQTTIYVTIVIETRPSAHNHFFFSVGNNLLHIVMLEKVADRGFLAFWSSKMSKTLKNHKITEKI